MTLGQTGDLSDDQKAITIPAAQFPQNPDEGAIVSELQTIRFAFDSYALSPEMLKRLESNAKWILKNTGIMIQIEGHCDERGSLEYNMNLGQKRADAVREQLYRLGVDPGRLITISFGEERPLPREPGDIDEEAWTKNRRAQFFIY